MSSFPRRAIRADALRNELRLLDATAEVIAIDPAASLEQIARHAGVTRATLYAHFPGRDALMDALTARSVSEVTDAVLDARPHEGSARDAMDRVLVAASRTIGRYRGLVIVNQRLGAADLRARTAPATQPVRALIARGQRTAEFDPALPTQWLLTVVLDLIHSASRQVSAGTMDPPTAQRALLRSARAALASHRTGTRAPAGHVR